VSRFSTHVRSVGQIFTHEVLSTTESFSTVTRACSKSHPTPNTECVTILYKYQISESSPHRRTFEHHRVFLGLLIRGVSRFSTHTGSMSQVLIDALLSTTEPFSAVTRARSKSHTTPNTGCVTILYKCEISDLNLHTCTGTCEHHRVFLGSASCA